MERSELTYQQSPRFILKSAHIEKYIDVLINEHKIYGDAHCQSPLLVVLDGFTEASKKPNQVRTLVMEEPGIEYFNWYIGLHKTFMEVMLEDKYVKYDLHGYVIYLYNKLLMIEGQVYILDQIKGFIDHFTKFHIVHAPIEPVESLQAFKIGCITVSIQDIRNLVAFAEKEGNLLSGVVQERTPL